MKQSWQFMNVAVLCCLLALSPYVNADDSDAATSAYKSGDYKTAFRLLGPLAREGNAEAQFNLGFMYQKLTAEFFFRKSKQLKESKLKNLNLVWD